MYFKQQLFLLARKQYYDLKLLKSTEKRFTSQIILNQINIEVKNKFYNFIKEVMALALQHDKKKPFEEITQVTERPAFANPISKATFEALPKIYGRAKKKKYLAKYQTQRKQPQQTQLKTRQNHQRFSLLNRPSTNKISAHDDSHNKVGKSEKRFKTQMKSFDKNYALQLSRPKNGFCSKKNCFCGQQHNCDHNKSIQKLQVKLQPVRKIKLPQIQKGIELEDVESKHKVSLATIERNQRQMNSSRKPFTLLDLLKSSQRKAKPSLEQNEKLQNKSNKTERQIIRKEVQVQFPLKTQCAAVQTEIEASAEQEDYKRKTQPLGSLLPNKTGRKVESSQSNRINKRQIQTSNPSKTSKIAEEIAKDKQKLKFKQMKAKQMQIEVIESQSEDGRSIRSSISSASLSKYVFQNAKKTNTMFQALKNKQTSSVKDQKAMNQSKVKTNNNKFVYQKKNGLFVIPEEDQYVSYLKNYESMNEKFKIKNLVRKPNFKVVKQEEGIYFGQFTDQIKNGKGIMVTDRNIFEGHYKDDLKTYGCQRNIDGVYKGEFLNGIREGFGSFEWNNGQIFEGEWKNGTKNGYGIWKSPKGDYYEGNWLLNRQHGKGIYKHKISTYRGYFVQFLKDGQGEEFFVNGDKYVGHYKKGKPNGFGKYQWADGSYYEGEFLNGVRQGRGKWVYSNGTVYEGEFKDDFKEGYGKQTYKSGERFEGTFVKGARSEGSLYDMHKKQIRISQSD